MKLIILLLSLSTLFACSATTIPTQASKLGTPSNKSALLANINQPGPIVFEKHLAANWAINLSGLVNLDHPKAIQAGLEDKLEDIDIYVYSLSHPQFGTYIVDSGISESLRDPESNTDISSIVKSVMGMDLLKVRKTTKQLNAEFDNNIKGVFLTHIHMDHIMGLTDLTSDVTVYIGPGDAAMSDVSHAATQGSTDGLLTNVDQLNEWQFDDNGIIDIFGDGSVWALHSPGHTPGATAYLVRTTTGPELLLGDATHTAWGWRNGVEPGSFSADIATSVVSLKKLLELSRNNPDINVHPGHQSLDDYSTVNVAE